MKSLSLLSVAILPFFLTAQSILGTWNYELNNTPGGDYKGELIIDRDQENYIAEIISSKESSTVNILYADERSFKATSEVSGWSVTITGELILNQLEGHVSIQGDLNQYPFTALRKKVDPIIQLVDAKTQVPLPYANILHQGNGIISNENGLFNIKNSTSESELIISAIGYKTITIIVNGGILSQTIQLTPISYSLPEIEIKAKSFSAEKIVEAAIKRIKDNYIQEAFGSDLFYRHSIYDQNDSLSYQSESLLKFYDSEGYKKHGWRKAASKRYAKLDQARVTTQSEKTDTLHLEELRRIFVSWSHSPLLSKDGPFSEIGMEGFEYDLVGVEHFEGKQVYVIEYRCTNLKEKYSGHKSMKSSTGKMYINKSDYALLRIEGETEKDWTWKGGKAVKNRGNKLERSIINSSDVRMFTKGEAGYYASYADITNHFERKTTKLNGEEITGQAIIREQYQYQNVSTINPEVLTENLFHIDIKNEYDQAFWDRFNFILKD